MNITFSGTPLEVRREMEIALGTVLGTSEKPLAMTAPKAEKTKSEPKGAEVAVATGAEVKSTPVVVNGPEVTAKLLGEEIPKKVKSAGRDAVVALLAKYDAKKGSELKPEQYAAFYADLGLLA